MNDRLVRTSRFLSFVLRHHPEAIGISLDSAGWADLDELVRAARAKGRDLTRETLLEVVARNDKRRFALSPDGARIRAVQGHSVPVDLGLAPTEPPPVLYHGTATRFRASIEESGLRPSGRTHVHLSGDVPTAVAVGSRHGVPVVFAVDAAAMRAAGHDFYRADNGVWLADRVPREFLEVVDRG